MTNKEYTPIFQILAAELDSSIDIRMKYPDNIPKEDVIGMLKDAVEKLENDKN